VPAIPKGMMQKAVWYIEHQATHIYAVKLGDGQIAYYFLSKDNDGGWNKITKRLVEMYEAALAGKKDPRIKTLEDLRCVCDALHFVRPAYGPYEVCVCEGNPTEHVCDCKSCKNYGICSHLLAINHVLKKFNVRSTLLSIGKKSSKHAKGGNVKRLEPALTRAPTREPDSSDEEEERLQRLGEQGK
jgi:hypothetical protein